MLQSVLRHSVQVNVCLLLWSFFSYFYCMHFDPTALDDVRAFISGGYDTLRNNEGNLQHEVNDNNNKTVTNVMSKTYQK